MSDHGYAPELFLYTFVTLIALSFSVGDSWEGYRFVWKAKHPFGGSTA
ncbi:hypothetical protein [Spirosoma foliorum]|uniref:Uncharacterized protein n=1 Tax=Spirosoma foliorum TaxID=2710596 RepID=A0A7G5GZ58_9BACT|nr:hypothetical protein [Spirosoma foliorum]QMW04150.1 hypothetical protein H3H32_04115 [Spirosoma foliorum]